MLIAALVSAILYIRALERRIKALFDEFFSADGDNPSPFALLTQSAGQVLAKQLVDQIKTSFGGMSSAASRQEKQLEGAAIRDLIGAHPLGAIGLGILPNVEKVIRKNPAIGAGILQLLAKYANQNASQQPGSNGSAENMSLEVQ
jgi:hypothetical protein